MSLRAKLVLWYTGVFGGSGAMLAIGLFALVAHRMQSEVDSLLQEEYRECHGITLAMLGDPERLAKAIEQEIGGARPFPLTYRLVDTRTGREIVARASARHSDGLTAMPPVPGPVLKMTRSDVLLGGKESRPLRLLTGPVDAREHSGLAVQVGMHCRLLHKRRKALWKYLLMILGSVVVVGAAGGWFLASRSLEPIGELAAELGRIESRNLGDRLTAGPRGQEVDRLREAVNRMLDRLEAAFQTLQHFTAAAAHELRTPLAALQCRLEVAFNRPRTEAETAEVLHEVFGQVAELSNLVADLLLLARMDAASELQNVAPVDVGALLEEVGEPFALLGEQRGVAFSVEGEHGLVTEGDASLLRCLFGNLLDNALRYTSAGGTVAARAAAHDGGCLVTVADTGIGIRPEALSRIFDRFYRADESRSRDEGGAGLGLSIVQRIVELHHGQITIESTPGEGTTARVVLPASTRGEA